MNEALDWNERRIRSEVCWIIQMSGTCVWVSEECRLVDIYLFGTCKREFVPIKKPSSLATSNSRWIQIICSEETQWWMTCSSCVEEWKSRIVRNWKFRINYLTGIGFGAFAIAIRTKKGKWKERVDVRVLLVILQSGNRTWDTLHL